MTAVRIERVLASIRIERVLAAALRLLPQSRRELGQALLAEASAVPPGRRRVAWIAGGLWFVVRESAVRKPAYFVGLVVAAAVLIGVDRIGTSDDSGMVSLAVLLLGSAALGFVAPRWAWLTGLVLGAAIALANLAYVTVGPAPARPISPAGATGAATLLVLIVPALIGAYLGAGAARLMRGTR